MPPTAPITKASTVSVSVMPRWHQISADGEFLHRSRASTSSGVEKKNWIVFGVAERAASAVSTCQISRKTSADQHLQQQELDAVRCVS